MLELPDLSQLTSEQKDEVIRFLFEEVKKLTARVKELEARLNKDSHNSSKPPSSDGFGKKKTSSLRKGSDKKPGGQTGHIGKALKRVAQADQTIVQQLPAHCPACGEVLSETNVQIVERRQVFDIPMVGHQVTEYCALSTRCTCGQIHTSDFPPEVSEATQYGPNVRALATHLTQGQLLPFARASELIADLFQLAISPGTLVLWASEASRRLQPTVEAIAEALRKAPVVGADESGLRVAAKLHWLHTAVTATHTWYGVHAKRGMEAIQAQGILTECEGTVVHDCWKPYWQLDCTHALCNAHLLRELVFIGETTAQAWPQQLMTVLLAAQDACQAARAANTTLTAENIEAIVTQYRTVVEQGQAINPIALRRDAQRGRVKQSAAFNLLARLHQHENDILRFVRDLTVPFTNNLAERAIRMPKVKQKISGSFRALNGAENFAVIRSYLDTMRKQGHRMLDSLRSVFAGQTVQPAGG